MRRSLPVVHFDCSGQFGQAFVQSPHHLAVLLGRHAVRQLLARGAAVDVLGSIVDEVLLAERPSAFAPDVIGFGNVTAMPASSQALISVLL
jgi:hypothetical protein